jgi:photosystem II stability/assembly factor-like uncharacterized protein
MRSLPLAACLAGALLAGAPASAGNAAGQLTLVRTGLPHDALFDAQFLNERGLAVGSHGAMLESLDGGRTWRALESLGDLSLTAIAMVPGRSIVVGQQGAIFVATDDGTHRRVDSGSSERLLSVDLDEETGRAVAVGGFGTLLTSDDAGDSWSPVSIDWASLTEEGMEAHLYDVEITSQGEIFVVGEFGLVLSSRDGGTTWQARAQGDESIFALHLGENGIGYAVGQNGLVLRSQDGGQGWERLDTGSHGNLLDVWASAQGEVVVVGIRTLLRSSDGGDTWVAATGRSVERAWYQALAAGTVTEKEDKLALHEQRVYAVGQTGKIISIDR